MPTLLWKEWREHAWKLAFATLLLGAFALIGLRARVIADEEFLQIVCTIVVLLLPLLAGTGLIPSERSDGSLDTLLALPVSPTRIFLAKTIVGIAICAAPIILAATVSVMIAHGRELSASAMLLFYARTLAATLALFFWILALTVGLPTETRAAMIAIGVLISWLIVTGGLASDWTPGVFPPPPASKFWLINPLVFLFGYREDYTQRPRIYWVVSLTLAGLIQGGISLALWFWASRQLSKPVEERV